LDVKWKSQLWYNSLKTSKAGEVTLKWRPKAEVREVYNGDSAMVKRSVKSGI
jgi:hypothetical protein